MMRKSAIARFLQLLSRELTFNSLSEIRQDDESGAQLGAPSSPSLIGAVLTTKFSRHHSKTRLTGFSKHISGVREGELGDDISTRKLDISFRI